jgi:hypothetical protein
LEKVVTLGQKIDWEDLAWDHDFQGDDKAMLERWYNVDRRTMEDIGRILGTSASTVSKRMRQLGIKITPITNAVRRGPRLPGRRRGK